MVRWMRRVRDRLSMRIDSREEWKRVRAGGHGRWILRQGVIGFGVPLVVLLLGLDYVTGGFPPGGDGMPSWLVVLLVTFVCVTGGYVLADREWHRAEERFE